MQFANLLAALGLMASATAIDINLYGPANCGGAYAVCPRIEPNVSAMLLLIASLADMSSCDCGVAVNHHIRTYPYPTDVLRSPNGRLQLSQI